MSKSTTPEKNTTLHPTLYCLSLDQNASLRWFRGMLSLKMNLLHRDHRLSRPGIYQSVEYEY